MLGAEALDVSPSGGRKLINLDSEAEGIFTVSCAGGSMARCVLPVSRVPFDGTALEVTVRGLAGGHSGTEIDKGRANACTALGRVLQAAGLETELRLADISGGGKDNAIPTEARARIAVSDEAAARRAVEKIAGDLTREYAGADPGLRVEAAACETGRTLMDGDTTAKVLCMLTCLPNGVQAMSRDIPGLVQTSLNLGILAAEEDRLTATFCVRSSLGSQKELLHRRLQALMEQLGGTVTVSGDYPAWEYRKDSPLRDLMTEVFWEQYGAAPEIEAIHAGVECGILAGKLPGLDAVSIGPDLPEIHTPRERMDIASVERVWRFLLEVLRRFQSVISPAGRGGCRVPLALRRDRCARRGSCGTMGKNMPGRPAGDRLEQESGAYEHLDRIGYPRQRPVLPEAAGPRGAAGRGPAGAAGGPALPRPPERPAGGL